MLLPLPHVTATDKVYLRIRSARKIGRAATLKCKMQIKLANSPSHSKLTPGKLALASDMETNRTPISKSLVRQGQNLSHSPAALKADASTHYAIEAVQVKAIKAHWVPTTRLKNHSPRWDCSIWCPQTTRWTVQSGVQRLHMCEGGAGVCREASKPVIQGPGKTEIQFWVQIWSTEVQNWSTETLTTESENS